jgi:predicted transcriptional regulator of viral defense system
MIEMTETSELIFPLRYSDRLSRASRKLLANLESESRPVISTRRFAELVVALYRNRDGLRLRHSTPDRADVTRLRRGLERARAIMPDIDYGTRALRILRVPDAPAEDICCLVDPTIYISHLSAMQRYGWTDRRPQALHLSRPNPRTLPRAPESANELLAALAPRSVSHPRRVRDREIHLFQTIHIGESLSLRSSFARIASVGQVFLDMVEEPELCGGMAHVLDIWRTHAAGHLDELVKAIDAAPPKMAKIRAGYILNELLGIEDSRVLAWTQFAQRGGSRLLDPAKPYAPRFSERWMLSINVE